eukprot:TRINITY_DN1705_c0_g2_i3.p1 TRINITY_DN1705_c0_g2~~TRINITY_DN1705_c0_g2_i3.p1  ORF type:complete len:392 (+),score=92.95 TRINITY_DN1705_c0_g2_i3:577-1752(+)
MATSGSGSKVIDESGQTQLRTQAVGPQVGQAASRGGKKEEEVSLSPGGNNLIHQVRDGTYTWCALHYENSQSSYLVPLSAGSGSVEELQDQLTDNGVIYALVRKVEQIDDSLVTKYCFVKWIGPNVPIMQKAKIGTHSGPVRAFFHPHHVTLDSPDKHEVNDDNIMKLIMIASGTYEHTLQSGIQKLSVATPTHTPTPVVVTTPKKTSEAPPAHLSTGLAEVKRVSSNAARGMGGVKQDETPTEVEQVIVLENEAAIKDSIRSVRLDDNTINWCLVTYTAPKSKTLRFHASGSGGLPELLHHLRDDVVMYGLIRMLEVIDSTEAIKFCFIDWRGENINRMQRANLGIHSGAVQDLFRPYHVDIQPTSVEEISEALIMQKINNASGTADHVL